MQDRVTKHQKPTVSKGSWFVKQARACLQNYAQEETHGHWKQKQLCFLAQCAAPAPAVPPYRRPFDPPNKPLFPLELIWMGFCPLQPLSLPLKNTCCSDDNNSVTLFRTIPAGTIDSCLAILPCHDLPISLLSSHGKPPRDLAPLLSPRIYCALSFEKSGGALVESPSRSSDRS